MAGCAESEPAPNVSSSPACSDGGNDTGNNDGDGGNQELVTINVWLNDRGPDGSGSKAEAVGDAINAIMEKDYGIHCEFTWIANADYGTQLGLAIANNETVDIATYAASGAASWLNLNANGSMLNMAQLLDNQGKDLKELLGPDILAATTVDNEVYGVSNYRQLNSSLYFYYSEDILEAIGATEFFDNMTSWSQFEELLEMIQEGTDAYGISGNSSQHVIYMSAELCGDAFSETKTWDVLGDPLGLVWSDQEGNVELATARQTLVDQYKMIARWFEAGYVHPDSPYNMNTTSQEFIAQGAVAGGTCMSEFGARVTKTQQCSTPIRTLAVADYYVSGANCRYFGMFIPVSSAEPEAAMTFLNALYTREDLMNLHCWGIEGETYVVRDGVGYCPDGTDTSTCGYHRSDFLSGNQFLVMPWDGAEGGKEFRDLAYADFLSAPKSVYMSLSVDTTGYDTLVAAVNAVQNEYFLQMANGAYTDAMYKEYMEKLQAAGIDEYIGIYQSAVDEFMA